MSEAAAGDDLAGQLRALRERADEDFHQPNADRPAGRHQFDVAELGLRVSVTRSLYPNRPGGVDQYAVTLSRPAMDRAPAEFEVRTVLSGIFGDAASEAIERPPAGRMVRMFRVPTDR